MGDKSVFGRARQAWPFLIRVCLSGVEKHLLWAQVYSYPSLLSPHLQALVLVLQEVNSLVSPKTFPEHYKKNKIVIHSEKCSSRFSHISQYAKTRT